MCKICKEILKYKDPKLVNMYKECNCKGICKFDEGFKKVKDIDILKLMYDYWNKNKVK